MIGQYGSALETMWAVNAIAATSSSCAHASARRGDWLLAAASDPTALPSASPIRNTARTTAKAYTAAPNVNASSRVQTTSPASAQNPEMPMATSTDASLGGGRTGAWARGFGSRRAFDGWTCAHRASINAPAAATTSMAAATYVAVITS